MISTPKSLEQNQCSGLTDHPAVLFAMSLAEKEEHRITVSTSLQGKEERYSFENFRSVLDTYKKMSDIELRNNIYAFPEAIIPAAKKATVSLVIHPEDPPHPISGLPQVVSKEADAKQLLEATDSLRNGLRKALL